MNKVFRGFKCAFISIYIYTLYYYRNQLRKKNMYINEIILFLKSTLKNAAEKLSHIIQIYKVFK